MMMTTMTMVCVGVSWAQYSVDNVVLSSQWALVGDTLMATCDVLNGPKTRITVYWVRETPNKRPVEIAVNRVLNPEFSHTGRYSLGLIKLNNDMSHLQGQLNITGQLPW